MPKDPISHNPGSSDDEAFDCAGEHPRKQAVAQREITIQRDRQKSRMMPAVVIILMLISIVVVSIWVFGWEQMAPSIFYLVFVLLVVGAVVLAVKSRPGHRKWVFMGLMVYLCAFLGSVFITMYPLLPPVETESELRARLTPADIKQIETFCLKLLMNPPTGGGETPSPSPYLEKLGINGVWVVGTHIQLDFGHHFHRRGLMVGSDGFSPGGRWQLESQWSSRVWFYEEKNTH